MYDRKTWIVLVACLGLLGVNQWYANKNRQAVLEKQKQEQAAVQAAAAAAPQGQLVVEPEKQLAPPQEEEKLIKLESDKVIFTLTSLGGGVKNAELKNEYSLVDKSQPLILNQDGAMPVAALSDSSDNFTSLNFRYVAEESVEGQKAVFLAKAGNGMAIKKTFSVDSTKKPASPFLLNFDLELENLGASPVQLDHWTLNVGSAAPMQAKDAAMTGFFWREGSTFHLKETSKFSGGMFSSHVAMIEESGDKMDYVGVGNEFYATVLRTNTPQGGGVWGKTFDVMASDGKNQKPKTVKAVRAGFRLPGMELAVGAANKKAFSYRIFMGPKDNTMFRKMDNQKGESGWGEVMSYGFFSFVSRPLSSLLNHLHDWFVKISPQWAWGFAVIALTIIVRTCIWPLHARSTRTMKRMSKLQPEMQKLREKYADNPQKMNTELMGLYKKYGVSPMGGCLPMFLQIPIFFGLFRMLQHAEELRHQSFLWVPDLSLADRTWELPFNFLGISSLNVLPIIMAITSFVQILMTPKTGDKAQQRIIMMMPFMFFFFCYNFAAALALYWTTQNLFSIGQTWLMQKMPEPELKAPDPSKPRKKSFMERLVEKQAEIERAQKGGQGGKVVDVQSTDVTDEKKKKRTPRTGG